MDWPDVKDDAAPPDPDDFEVDAVVACASEV